MSNISTVKVSNFNWRRCPFFIGALHRARLIESSPYFIIENRILIGDDAKSFINIDLHWSLLLHGKSQIFAADISSDKKFLVIYSDNQTSDNPQVAIWDAQTGKNIRRFRNGTRQTSRMDFPRGPVHLSLLSPDGKTWVLDNGSRVTLTNLETGSTQLFETIPPTQFEAELTGKVPKYEPLKILGFSQDSTIVAISGKQDKYWLRFVNVADGAKLWAPLSFATPISMAKIFTDENYAAVLNSNGEVTLWNLRGLAAPIYESSGAPFKMSDGSPVLNILESNSGSLQLTGFNSSEIISVEAHLPKFKFPLELVEHLQKASVVRTHLTLKEPFDTSLKKRNSSGPL